MTGTDYKPKFFKSVVTELRKNKRSGVFTFKSADGKYVEKKVDESVEQVEAQMADVRKGKKEKVYLTKGMRDIDIDLLPNGNWRLFDEFDIYEFSLEAK